MYIHFTIYFIYMDGENACVCIYKLKKKNVWAKYFTLSNSLEQRSGLRDDARDSGTLGGLARSRLLPQSTNRAAHRESGPSRRSAAVRGSLLGCFLTDRRKS